LWTIPLLPGIQSELFWKVDWKADWSPYQDSEKALISDFTEKRKYGWWDENKDACTFAVTLNF